MKFVFFFIYFWLPFAAADFMQEIVDKSRIPQKHFGLWLMDGEKVYKLNAEQKLIPASLSKIPTAAAVLSELGLEHQFETKILSTGSVEEDVLMGDIYLQGGGDPSFVSESLWSMVNELKRTGIRKINGQLYVDDSLYDEKRFSDSRQNHRVDRAYDAPVGALSFNWNSVNVFVRPALKVGQPAFAFADPENEYIELKNLSKTGKKTELFVDRKASKNGNLIEVRGTIAVDAKEQVIYKSVSSPELWTGSNLKTFLNQQGIAYRGSVLKKKTPSHAKLLVSFKSKPLSLIVADMSKFSNNYVAEMLTKALSQKTPADLESGVARIRSWLMKKNWRPEHFIFNNPSGFSRENQLRPADLGELLQLIHKDFSYSPEFMSSLPIAGIDGTLKKRLKDQKGFVRAKTGNLDGVIGLAGYYSKNAQEYPFVFIYNGPESNDAKAKDVFDEILRQILRK